jgi:glycosyltransferase involved in cell wall biosynthesis
LKILYLTEFLSAIGGGGEVAFQEIAKAIAKRGHAVHILCYDSVDTNSSSVAEADRDDRYSMSIYRIKPKLSLAHGHFPSILQQGAYIVNALIKGAQVIRKSEIDVIHANTLCPAIAGTILAVIFHKPVVITVHHVYTLKSKQYRTIKECSTARSIILSWISDLPKLICEKIIVSLPVDVIHAVSESTKSDLIRFGARSKIAVISNGIDITRYQTDHADSLESSDIVLFIGRLVEYKNLNVVVSAFRIIAKEHPKAKLVIVGDGPARDKLGSMVLSLGISGKVEFTGYISDEKKLELLHSCSVLVFPSLIEGFGLAILEGLAAGKPVLVSNVAPSNEIIRNGIEGFVLPPLEANEWASKILSLIQDIVSQREIGTNGKKTAATDFDISKIAERFDLLYRYVISKHVMGQKTNSQTTAPARALTDPPEQSSVL